MLVWYFYHCLVYLELTAHRNVRRGERTNWIRTEYVWSEQLSSSRENLRKYVTPRGTMPRLIPLTTSPLTLKAKEALTRTYYQYPILWHHCVRENNIGYISMSVSKCRFISTARLLAYFLERLVFFFERGYQLPFFCTRACLVRHIRSLVHDYRTNDIGCYRIQICRNIAYAAWWSRPSKSSVMKTWKYIC